MAWSEFHRKTAMVLLTCLAFGLAGCRITTSKNATNGKDNVAIETPLGGLNVKIDPVGVTGKIGLPIYPGARPVTTKRGDDDSGSADVDLSFGGFQLRVLAASFETGDTPEKVEAFYRPALAQYSDVIACRDHMPVGLPGKTGLGLTCADTNKKLAPRHGASLPVLTHTPNADEHALELKAGSPTRQHIVSIEERSAKTRIGLVALELPRGLPQGNGD